jgi:hypothetical protein
MRIALGVVRKAGTPLLLVWLMGCHRSQPAPPATQAFLTGPCPGQPAMPDTNDVALRERIGFAPPYFHPHHARGVGVVTARLTVDTFGHVEPGSLSILASNNPELSATLCSDIPEQNYYPSQVGGVKRRTRGNLLVTFANARP